MSGQTPLFTYSNKEPFMLAPLSPGFMVLQGNRLEDLREVAVHWLAQYPLRPLEDECILVQSNGMAQWLKMALATNPQGQGIAAALNVQLPGRFIWQAYRSVFAELPRLFERFHRVTAGSLTRTEKWWDIISGTWNWDQEHADPEIRTAVHYDARGEADGYVSYKFVSTRGFQGYLKVVDLVSPSSQVRIALWEYLCNLDLVTEVRYNGAQMEDPLMWGMADMSAYTVRRRYERLWLRVLDPVAALSARHYTSHRSIRMSVVDSMGFADGIYEIDTTGDAPRVERVADRPRTQDDLAGKSMPAVELPDGADVALNVDSLGSLYLGAVKASTLHYAGLLRVRDDAALRDIQALMSTPTHPYCISPF